MTLEFSTKRRDIMQKLFLPLLCIGCLLFFGPAAGEARAESSSETSSSGGASQRVKIVQPEKQSPEKQQPEEKSRTEEKEKAPAAAKKPKKETAPQETAASKKSVSKEAAPAKAQTGKQQAPAPEQRPASASSGETGTMSGEAGDLMGDAQQYYVSKGRPDPFAPFVSGEEREEEEGKGGNELRPDHVKGPLEKMRLSQLRLTAVMKTPGRNLALVEEASGKGYVVKKGTYIGDQGGKIVEILSDAIVVEEKYRDAFGNVAVRKKELKLQK